MKFSNDGRELLAGSNDYGIYIYNLETKGVSSRFEAHTVLFCFTFFLCFTAYLYENMKNRYSSLFYVSYFPFLLIFSGNIADCSASSSFMPLNQDPKGTAFT